jgi:hypothetical protein
MIVRDRPTDDVYYQFQGYRDDLAEHIRLYSPHPSVAFSEARRFPDHVRPDWRKVNIQMVRLLDCQVFPCSRAC